MPVGKRTLVKHILLLIFTTYYKTGLVENCDVNSDCHESPDWHDAIFCQSVFNINERLLHVNCSWVPYTSTSSEYKLHLVWPDLLDCDVISVNGTLLILWKDKLLTDEVTIIWVSHRISDQLCVKTNNFSILPEVKCEPPNIQQTVHSSNVLRFQLDKIGQVRYREIISTQWHTINVTNMSASVSLPGTLMPTSYVVQQRCLHENCFHCKWGLETSIPHELTGAPDIIATTEKLSPGKQRVTVEWKYIKHDYVDGYIVTIQRLPNSCNYNITFKTTDTKFQINLSVAFFNVLINAYNKAGNSTLARTAVHRLTTPELPGKIFATYKNNTIFLKWSPLFECDFIVINWGTSSSQMESTTLMDKIENYSIPGPFDSMKRYMIMIYLYDLCQCQDSTNETTFGITSIYTEEGVPRTGPWNITVKDLTKTSAVIEWGDIPEEDCLGFLLGYIIYYTDVSRNSTLEIFVNSSSERSYQIMGLSSSREYEVTVSGVTSKGPGMPSASHGFKTENYAEAEFQILIISTCVGIIITTVILVSVCAYTIHRKKNSYFPKIPDPKHSHIIKMNEETPTKIKLLQSSQFHESSCDSPGVEVIEQVPVVSTPTESNIQKREISTVGKKAQQPVHDYTSMMSMLKVFQRMPQANDNIN